MLYISIFYLKIIESSPTSVSFIIWSYKGKILFYNNVINESAGSFLYNRIAISFKTTFNIFTNNKIFFLKIKKINLII